MLRPGSIARPLRLVALGGALCLGSAPPARAVPRTEMVTGAGLVRMTITNLGYVGNGLSSPYQPSCEYPSNSHVEHLFIGGLWVGAMTPEGLRRVSTGAQDASNLTDGEDNREFTDSLTEDVQIWSNTQNSDDYNPAALATEHIECYFTDDKFDETGNHTPLFIKVILRVLSWSSSYADDFIILDYRIVNDSGTELRDVYVGYWNDTTVGNTTITVPSGYGSGAPRTWQFYDDMNGAWRPGDVADDPDLWMMYEHDDDGEEGMATSWIGARLLGSTPAPSPAAGLPPVTYNSWRFRSVPAQDDAYEVDGQPLPGKYQMLSNGDFDAGGDFAYAGNWNGLLATGPFPNLAPGDTLQVTYAVVCGADSLNLLANAKVAQVAYDSGFAIPTGPPSPRLNLEYDDNTVVLAWAPGDSVALDDQGEPVPLLPDDPRRSPEHHVSIITQRPDFQGYRIFRFQGESFGGDPYEQSTMVAQFDKIDGIGFDTGLPPLGVDGLRRFRDTSLLDGFGYWYSVVSFSAPDVVASLPEFQSGYYENAELVYPGPAPRPLGEGRGPGVFPNPYRVASRFDDQQGEQELGRKLWFTGLPARCVIKVFNLGGDLVKTLHHDDPASGLEPWDILSEPVRAIASGLYIFAVEDLATGRVERGKLVIIK
ncbi:MAG: hypothetical protein IPM94_10745 [bacterium]|nr:hypothetical protein [bacterium]